MVETTDIGALGVVIPRGLLVEVWKKLKTQGSRRNRFVTSCDIMHLVLALVVVGDVFIESLKVHAVNVGRPVVEMPCVFYGRHACTMSSGV